MSEASPSLRTAICSKMWMTFLTTEEIFGLMRDGCPSTVSDFSTSMIEAWIGAEHESLKMKRNLMDMVGRTTSSFRVEKCTP